jgi:hypothetical protein
MKSVYKLAIISLATIPALASAQTYLYINDQQPHFDIDGITGGGPFIGEVLSGPSQTVIATETLFCDSVTQEFSLGDTFQVTIEPLDAGGNTSLDPWVITHADHVAQLFDHHNNVQLSNEEIDSAIQGVIWNLDGQIAAGPMTSSDANTASFADFLLFGADHFGTTNITGYDRFDAAIDFGPGGVGYGQSQIGMTTPEPSAAFALGLPLAGLVLRRRVRK